MNKSCHGVVRAAQLFRRTLHKNICQSAETNCVSQTRCFCMIGKHSRSSIGRVLNPSVKSLALEKNIEIHQRFLSLTRPLQFDKDNQSSDHDVQRMDDHKINPGATTIDEISKDDLNLVLQATIDEKNGNDQNSMEAKIPDSLSDIPGATTGRGKKLAIVFTCSVCNTRSAKKFSEQAYLNGVVMVRCPGCENLHLIADRLGFFEDRGEDGKGWDIESFMKDMGENVKAVNTDNVLELTIEDVLGKTKLEELGNNVVQRNESDKGKDQ